MLNGLKIPVAVIGGTGFYSLDASSEPISVDTPFGTVEGQIEISSINNTRVAFLPRHKADHSVPPHEINYAANLWALHKLGVDQIVAPCAVGSLRPALAAGSIVVPDQLVDRTSGRQQTLFSQGGIHVPFADPYCDHGRAVARAVANRLGIAVVDRGTMVVINGPRFSTRAESSYYASCGWDIINMTGCPEALFARELGICYNPIALVTDADAGVDSSDSVDQEVVCSVFADNVDRLRGYVLEIASILEIDADCICRSSRGSLSLPSTSRESSTS